MIRKKVARLSEAQGGKFFCVQSAPMTELPGPSSCRFFLLVLCSPTTSPSQRVEIRISRCLKFPHHLHRVWVRRRLRWRGSPRGRRNCSSRWILCSSSTFICSIDSSNCSPAFPSSFHRYGSFKLTSAQRLDANTCPGVPCSRSRKLHLSSRPAIRC